MGRVRLRVRDIDYSTKKDKCENKKENEGGIAELNEIEKLDIALNQGGRSSKSR